MRRRPAVHAYDQRRPLALRRDEVRVVRRVEQRVRGLAAGRRVLERPRDGDVGGVDDLLAVGAQRLERPALEVDRDDPRRARGGGADEQRARAVGGQVDDPRQLERHVAQPAGSSTTARWSRPSLVVRADDAAVGQERVPRLAEDPQRPADLGLERGQRLAVAVEVPPAGAVGAVVQDAVRAPLGLHDRLARAARDEPSRRERRRELRDPQLRALPRHPRVVPGQPRDPLAVRRDPRRGVEVVARGEHARLGRAVDGHRDEVVDVLGLAVALAHADQPVAGDPQVGVAQSRTGRRARA